MNRFIESWRQSLWLRRNLIKYLEIKPGLRLAGQFYLVDLHK